MTLQGSATKSFLYFDAVLIDCDAVRALMLSSAKREEDAGVKEGEAVGSEMGDGGAV